MLEFVFRFEELLDRWPKDQKWTFEKIAAESEKSIEYVIDILSNILSQEFDLNAQIPREEGVRAYNILQERLKPQISAWKQKVQRRKDQAIKAYDITMEKVRVLQLNKNWHSIRRNV